MSTFGGRGVVEKADVMVDGDDTVAVFRNLVEKKVKSEIWVDVGLKVELNIDKFLEWVVVETEEFGVCLNVTAISLAEPSEFNQVDIFVLFVF